MLKGIFCNHRYVPSKDVKSQRNNNDNLVIYCTFYKCLKCGNSFTIQDEVKVEKDYYLKERA